MRDAGSTTARIWGGIKGALGHLEHVNYVGPKALNGGEVLVSAGEWSWPRWFCGFLLTGIDGECEYIYRMQNTVDHTNVSKLAEMVGVKVVPSEAGEWMENDSWNFVCDFFIIMLVQA
jgi:hypothetical protein